MQLQKETPVLSSEVHVVVSCYSCTVARGAFYVIGAFLKILVKSIQKEFKLKKTSKNAYYIVKLGEHISVH